MKSPQFAYRAPRSIKEAVDALVEADGMGKILAGGQSLVPTMNFRLARPDMLIDINRISELDYAKPEGGKLRIGALTRHAAFERPFFEGTLARLMADVVQHMAHVPIRTRGTFTGSLAHADPASEWCLVACTLDAEMVAHGPDGERVIPASDYFVTTLTTALAENELLVEARLPLLDETWKHGFSEFNRRAGDFALSMSLVALKVENGRIVKANIGIGGVEDKPVRASNAEAYLVGKTGDAADRVEAARIASEDVQPMDDMHAPADYRRDLTKAMVRRALERALAR